MVSTPPKKPVSDEDLSARTGEKDDGPGDICASIIIPISAIALQCVLQNKAYPHEEFTERLRTIVGQIYKENLMRCCVGSYYKKTKLRENTYITSITNGLAYIKRRNYFGKGVTRYHNLQPNDIKLSDSNTKNFIKVFINKYPQFSELLLNERDFEEPINQSQALDFIKGNEIHQDLDSNSGWKYSLSAFNKLKIQSIENSFYKTKTKNNEKIKIYSDCRQIEVNFDNLELGLENIVLKKQKIGHNNNIYTYIGLYDRLTEKWIYYISQRGDREQNKNNCSFINELFVNLTRVTPEVTP